MARLNTRADEEQQPLLSDGHANGQHHPDVAKFPDETDTRTTSISTFLNKNVSDHRADALLICSFFVSGMIDAGAYNAYECFTSMQTGNTVFAALGASDLPVSSPKLAWTKSLTSMLSFLLGSLTLTLLHRRLGPRKRYVFALSAGLQAVLIAISAVLVQQGHSSGSPVSGGEKSLSLSLPKDPGFPWLDLLPIALLSFQAAGKVVASRMTSQIGLPVVVLTTLYNDLIADPSLFSAGLRGDIQRNRKLSGLVLYFCGAAVGGVAARGDLGFSGLLVVACGIQAIVAAGWAVWYEDSEKNERWLD